MTIAKRRLIHVEKSTSNKEALLKSNSAYAKSIAFYAGNVEAEADIITHGESYVQAPLDERERLISGTDLTSTVSEAGTTGITKTPLAKIGSRNDGKTNTSKEAPAYKVAKADATGITLSNLNKLIGDLNDYVISTNANANSNLAVTLEKVTSTIKDGETEIVNPDNWAAVYQIKQGGTRVANTTINIPKDQFLNRAGYVSDPSEGATWLGTGKSADDAKEISGWVGDGPHLLFEWQYSTAVGDTTGHAITAVPVGELVDTYVGATSTKKVTPEKYNNKEISEISYVVTTSIKDSDELATEEEAVGTASGEGGKIIVTTLDDNITGALAKAEAAGNYTDQEVKELASVVGTTHPTDGTHVYSGTDEVLNAYKPIKDTATTDADTKVTTHTYSSEYTTDDTRLKAKIGTGENDVTVAHVLAELTKGFKGNQDEIIALKTNADNIQENLDEAVKSLEVNGHTFVKSGDKKKATIDAGDVQVTVIRETSDLPSDTQSEAYITTSEDHIVGIKKDNSILEALIALEMAWEWQEELEADTETTETT